MMHLFIENPDSDTSRRVVMFDLKWRERGNVKVPGTEAADARHLPGSGSTERPERFAAVSRCDRAPVPRWPGRDSNRAKVQVPDLTASYSKQST